MMSYIKLAKDCLSFSELKKLGAIRQTRKKTINKTLGKNKFIKY